VQKSECAHTHIPDTLMYLSNVPINTIYLSDVPIYTSNMPMSLSDMFVVQGEITALNVHIPSYLSNIPMYLSNMPIFTSNMPIHLSYMLVVQGEVTALNVHINSYLSNIPTYLSNMPIYTSNMPMSLSDMFVVQGEITALRGDVAHLFLALKAAESRHEQELAGVIIDAAQHQTKVSISLSWVSPRRLLS